MTTYGLQRYNPRLWIAEVRTSHGSILEFAYVETRKEAVACVLSAHPGKLVSLRDESQFWGTELEQAQEWLRNPPPAKNIWFGYSANESRGL